MPDINNEIDINTLEINVDALEMNMNNSEDVVNQYILQVLQIQE
ncbi:6617_t:CDS:1, partial [Cetraspora pellucida]